MFKEYTLSRFKKASSAMSSFESQYMHLTDKNSKESIWKNHNKKSWEMKQRVNIGDMIADRDYAIYIAGKQLMITKITDPKFDGVEDPLVEDRTKRVVNMGSCVGGGRVKKINI